MATLPILTQHPLLLANCYHRSNIATLFTLKYPSVVYKFYIAIVQFTNQSYIIIIRHPVLWCPCTSLQVPTPFHQSFGQIYVLSRYYSPVIFRTQVPPLARNTVCKFTFKSRQAGTLGAVRSTAKTTCYIAQRSPIMHCRASLVTPP